jgi:hypothetical protein
MRLDDLQIRQEVLGDPARAAVRAARDADLHPGAPGGVEPRLERDVGLGRAVLRVPAQRADGPRAGVGRGADLPEHGGVGPAGELALVRQALVGQRRVVALGAERQLAGRRDGGCDQRDEEDEREGEAVTGHGRRAVYFDAGAATRRARERSA